VRRETAREPTGLIKLYEELRANDFIKRKGINPVNLGKEALESPFRR
jgi:hypothetical protein